MFKSILRFVKSAYFLSMFFACVFGAFATNSFAGGCGSDSKYYNNQSNPNTSDCSYCPSSSDWSTQHISDCGGINNVFTCAGGYTVKFKYGGGLECGCGNGQFAYYNGYDRYDFVCVDCSFAINQGSSTQNYIDHCGWQDYTTGYDSSFSCRDGFTQEKSVYYGTPYYKCTCAGSGVYVFGTKNTTSATCLRCNDTVVTGATCGSGNFTCGQGYIRSKDGSKYRCADCALSSTNSLVSSPIYGQNWSNVYLHLVSGANITKTIASDACKVTLTWTNSSACNATQVYEKAGVARDASYTNNATTNRTSKYNLTSTTITSTAVNYYGYGGNNGTSSIQCRQCADGYWTAAASGKDNIPLSCNSAPLHGSVSGGVVTCDKNYYKYGNSGTACQTCPQYGKNGTELTAEYLWNNSGNPNLSIQHGVTSTSGATSITQCYQTVSGSDGTGSYSYPNPCYYSGSSNPYWYVKFNSPSQNCKSALARYCEEYVKGTVMSEFDFEDYFGDDVDQFENCAKIFYTPGQPTQLYDANDIVWMSKMTFSACSPSDFGESY